MIVSLLIAIIVAGLLVWLLAQLPLDPVIVRIGRAVVVVVLVLYLVKLLLGWRAAPL